MFYSIALTDLGFKTWIILDIRIIVKLDGITYWMKLKDRFGNKRKTRSKDIT